MHSTRSLALVGAALAALAAGCTTEKRDGGAGASTGATTAATTRCPGDNAGLTLPDGFCATIFADSIGEARHVVVSPDGYVYVAIQKPKSPEQRAEGKQTKTPGAVAVLHDGNGDGRSDSVAYIPGTGNTGVALHDGYLYADELTRVVRWQRKDGEGVPSGKMETVVSGIPGPPGHVSRNFVIARDGSLFLNVGSATNSCQVKDRLAKSPGHDPCTELQTRAGIWRFDANKTGQSFSPSARYATGIRNAMGITLDPNGQLWTTQHGRDNLADNWGFDAKYSAENPAEELFPVSQGDDFGWPYCYFSVDEKKLVLAPEYGGDGKKTTRCEQKKGPAAWFPGHWAPMSALFYTGSQFPDKYRGGVLIAFHGSWNRAPEPQAGYKVVFQPMSGGKTSGDYETFIDGFAGGQMQPDRAVHRPVGLAQMPDGSLLVTDDKAGRVYRVTYRK